MENNIKQVLEIVSDVQEHMASKDDLAGLERSLRSEISENTRAIAALSDGLRGQAGFAKEIDLLMSRLKVVEHHLGLAQDISA